MQTPENMKEENKNCDFDSKPYFENKYKRLRPEMSAFCKG